MRFTRVAALGLVVASVGPALAQERIENPEYASWVRFKKGTSMSVKSVNMSGGKISEVITTSILLDTGPESVLIQSSTLVKDKVMDFRSDPEKRQEARLILLPMGLPKGLSREDYAASKPPGTTEEGTEVLKIAGLEVKTKWYKYKAEVAGTTLEGKRWVSSEVPGNIVKSDVTTSGGIITNLKLELIELRKPQ